MKLAILGPSECPPDRVIRAGLQPGGYSKLFMLNAVEAKTLNRYNPDTYMKHFRIALIVFFITSICASGNFDNPPQELENGKWVSVFNGIDLAGWKIHGTEKWYVEDGELVCESGPEKKYGYFATEKKYTDFEFRVDFIQESNGNSGVFFRSSIEGTKITGWQVEVAPPDHDTGGIYESYGRGWLVQIPDEKENILQMGKWNALRIRVVGDKVTTWLNGVKMVEMEDEKIGEATGSIALQIHSGGGIKLRWKNILVKEIK